MSDDFGLSSESETPFKLNYLQSETNGLEAKLKEYYATISSAFLAGNTDENSLSILGHYL